ncbi:MAG TPA: hypothetical protein VF003_01345 [Pseudonocardiaceae bacterium]
MQIAILLYHRFTALDALGPYEVLRMLPQAEVVFVGEQAGPVTNDHGSSSWSPKQRSAMCAARISCWCPADPARTIR